MDSAALEFLSRGTARIASATALRQFLSMGMLALTSVVVARTLGPDAFGQFVGGTAPFNLASAMTDFGFSLLLVREMSRHPAREGHFLGSALGAQLVWSGGLTVVLAIAGISVGGERGTVMLVLCPALLMSTLIPFRQIFAVRFRASPLLIVDITTTIAQCIVMIALALLHAPVYALAVNISVFGCLTAAVSAVLSRRLIRPRRPGSAQILRFFRRALPMGVASVLASLYFIIDLALLGWLVPPQSVGQYAAAVRILTVIVTVPGFIMGAGVPGLSRATHDQSSRSQFVATLAHWIFAFALPLGVAVAVFARPIVEILFGSAYLSIVPIVRILALAGGLSLISNITGITMMTLGIIRPQIYFNLLALIINVAGNLLLVPRYGITAAAWLTVASEAIVVSYGVVVLRAHIDYLVVAKQLWRPVAAVVGAGLLGWSLGGGSLVAILAAGIAFLALMSLVHAWPDVLVSWMSRNRRASEGSLP